MHRTDSAHISRTSFAVSDCRELRIPWGREEVSTVLDIERGLITASCYDPALQADRHVTFRYGDPACMNHPEVRLLIDHVMEVYKAQQVQLCASVREMIRRHVTEIDGRPVNLDAARTYLRQWCATAP